VPVVAESVVPDLESSVHVRATPSDMLPFESPSVIEGTPTRTVLPIFQGGSSGNQFRAALWTTTPCTIRIEQPLDTVMYVVKGAADVQLDTGEQVSLVAGDVFALPKGVRSTWRFTEDFEEFVVYAA
jgi:uncharacterized cupin superfamily protein